MGMNDRQLRLIVIDELDFEPSIDATRIDVSVELGMVTLGGYARSYAEKRAAEKVACRVRGVRAVSERIEVAAPNGKPVGDAELTRRALDTLAWDATVPDSVRVKVRSGHVRLSGLVDWHYQRQAAEHAVSRLAGILGISNLIAIRPGSHVYDIGRAIEDALRRSAELDACNIRVLVADDDTVMLEGEVHAWFERAIAERAAWSAPGVKMVEDRLLVA